MNTERVVAFDYLRAIMVFLLIILHSAVPFVVTPIAGWYNYEQGGSNMVFDVLVASIHAFRLPVFFIISGYLTERLFQNKSVLTILARRMKRLLIPFLVILFTLAPLSNFILYYLQNGDTPMPINARSVWDHGYNPEFLTSYVWFLYYLILYTLGHAVICHFKLTDSLKRISLYRRLFLLLLLVNILLYLGKNEMLFGSYGFIPGLDSLGGYLLFYLLGVSFFADSGFDLLKTNHRRFLVIGGTALLFFFGLKSGTFAYRYTELFTAFLYSAVNVFLSLGILGFALSQMKTNSKFFRSISRSSYFIYLIHFPIVVLLFLFVRKLELDPIVKFVLISGFGITFSLAFNSIWNLAWRGNAPV